LALTLAPAALYLVNNIFITFYRLYTKTTGVQESQRLPMSYKTMPVYFLNSNLSIAIDILIAVGIAFILFRQHPRYMSSITGKFRWRLFWRFLLTALPFFGIFFIGIILMNGLSKLNMAPNILQMCLIIVLTIPLQCAGEEYLYRGLVNRAFGALFSNRMIGLIVGATGSSICFAYMHSSIEPWGIAFYFISGIISCLLVWKTGGLEAPIAFHIINNFVVFGVDLLVFSDSPDGFINQKSTYFGALPQVLVKICTMLAMLYQARYLTLPTDVGVQRSQTILTIKEKPCVN
jgi:membrane protease YdiL (CAAX protease family)